MQHYVLIAELFKYPGGNLFQETEEAQRLISQELDSQMESYLRFNKHVAGHTLKELQEYYVNTFDEQALCYLDIGYVLFGDDLKRGNFLVQLLAEHKKCNHEIGSELPDHLPNVLELLTKTTDAEFANEFVQFILLPAVLSMIKSFKDGSNVYQGLLQVLKEFLKKDFHIEEININIPAKDQKCVLAGQGCQVSGFENIKY